jgi:Tfp pilus assembly protein PilV
MSRVMRPRTASCLRRAARPAIRAGLGRLRADETGSSLIEVMVTATILVVVILGTFAAFDGASASSSSTKSRAIGAGIAQQDQERLRAFKSTDLSNYRETRTQTVGGVAYTVVSRADWVVDSTGSTSCGPAGSNAQANYVEITSTVTWPVMRSVQPVVQKSYVAPPNGSFGTDQGSLCVQVTCETTAKPGLPVTLTGGSSYSDVTDSTGSVFFGYIPAGNYTVTVGDTGIDPLGASPPSKQVSVVGATTSTVALLDCGPGSIGDTSGGGIPGTGATFVTTPLSSSQVASSNKWGWSIGHPSLPAPSFRTFNVAQSVSNNQTPAANAYYQQGNLYPFGSPYSIYAGNCQAMRPDAAGTDPMQTVQVNAGQIAGPINIKQPSLNVLATTGAGLTPTYQGARVRVTPSQPEMNGCSGTITLGTTGSTGKLSEPGVPYGTYSVCVDKTGPVQSVTKKVTVASSSGTSQIQFNLGAGSATACS